MKVRFLNLVFSVLLGFSGVVFADGKSAQEHYEGAMDKHAEAAAKIFNISHEESLRRLKLQAAAGKNLVTQLKGEFQERFAGSYIEHDPIDRMVVRLKGDVEVADRRLEVDGDVLLVEFVTGQAYTKTELEDILSKNREELFNQISKIQGSFVDEKTGGIVLIVFIREGDISEIERMETIAKNILGVSVMIHRVPVEFTDFASVRGGGNLSGLSSMSSKCTSGFSIKNTANSIKGLLTAGHCSDGDKVYFDGNGNTALLKQQQSINSLTADVMWYKSAFSYPPNIGAQIEPKFYAKSTTTPTILTGKRTRTSLQKGEPVCHRGRTTGYSCGVIASTNFGLASCNDSSCKKWIVVFPSKNTEQGFACAGGDSGGPLFIASEAVGIMKGGYTQGSSIGECVGAVYMSTDEISVLGLELLYGP